MEWSDVIYDALELCRQQPKEVFLLDEILPYWDVTNLNGESSEQELLNTFAKAQRDEIFAPAVCVYPRWVKFAVNALKGTPTYVATVVNFPKGDAPLQAVGIQIEEAISDGAKEIDAVFPYHHFLAGDREIAIEFVSYCKSLCGDALLKIILETSALHDPQLIIDAAKLAAFAGADFIKTSTGKAESGGATIESAAAILVAIEAAKKECPQAIGLKVSGGIKSFKDATRYRKLAEMIMGKEWVTPRHFRIGASNLE